MNALNSSQINIFRVAVFMIFAGVAMSLILINGVYKPYNRFLTIYNTAKFNKYLSNIEKDSRVYKISQEKLDGEINHEYKIVVKDGCALSLKDVEDLVFNQVQDLINVTEKEEIKAEENSLIYYQLLSSLMVMNGVYPLGLYIKMNKVNSIFMVFLIPVITGGLGLWFLFDGYKLFRLSDIRRRSDNEDSQNTNNEFIYVDQFVKVMTIPEYDEFKIVFEREQEIK